MISTFKRKSYTSKLTLISHSFDFNLKFCWLMSTMRPTVKQWGCTLCYYETWTQSLHLPLENALRMSLGVFEATLAPFLNQSCSRVMMSKQVHHIKSNDRFDSHSRVKHRGRWLLDQLCWELKDNFSYPFSI